MARSMTEPSTVSGVTSETMVGAEQSTNLARLFALLRKLEPGARHPCFAPKVLYLGQAVEAIQPLALILNPHIAWTQQSWLCKVPYFFHLAHIWDPSMVDVTRTVAVAFYWGVALILAMVWGLLFYIFKSGSDDTKVRNIARVSVHAVCQPLLWPLWQLLLGQTTCKGGSLWLFPDEACWSGLHLATFAVGIAAVLLLFATACVVITCVYDANPFSRHPCARAHSLGDSLYLVYKFGTLAAFHAMLSREHMQQEYCFIIFLVSFAMATGFALVVPYYSLYTQRLRVASLLGTSWAALVGYVLHKDEGGDHISQHDYAAATFLAVLPVVWVIGWYVAGARVSTRCLGDFRDILSGKSYGARSGTFPRNLPESDDLFSPLRDLEDSFMVRGQDDDVTATRSVLSPFVTAVWWPSDIELATRNLVQWHRVFQLRPTGAMLAMATRVYAKGLVRFRDSVLVQIHLAGFLIRYLDHQTIAVNFLSKLEHMEALKGRICDQYIVFRMSTNLKADLGIRDRAHVHTLQAARRHHKEALTQMQQFWLVLSDKANLSLMNLAVLANQISDQREKARIGFQSVLSQHSSDIQILRHFAAFLQQVMLDEASYERCKDEYEQLQSARAEQRQARAGGRDTGTVVSTVTGSSLRERGGMSKVVSEILANIQNNSSSRSGSRTVQVLQITIRVVFTPLLLILIGYLLLAVFYSKDHIRVVEQMYDAGQVRLYSQESCYVLQRLIGEVTDAVKTYGSIEAAQSNTQATVWRTYHDRLAAVADAFSAHANSLTFGTHKVTYLPMQVWFKKHTVDMRIFNGCSHREGNAATCGQFASQHKVLSVWSLGSFISTALAHLITIDPGEVATDSYTKSLLENANGPIAHAFNRSTLFLQDESESILSTADATAITLFISAIVMIFVVDLMFVWNFNKIAQSKMTTLELFTLIPEGTVQMTHQEAHRKVLEFDAEESGMGVDAKLITGPDTSDNMGDSVEKAGATETDEHQNNEEDDDADDEIEVYAQKRNMSQDTGELDDSQTRRRVMTTQEALKSLEDSTRKQSLVAMVLARGLEEDKELAALEASRHGPGHVTDGSPESPSAIQQHDRGIAATKQTEIAHVEAFGKSGQGKTKMEDSLLQSEEEQEELRKKESEDQLAMQKQMQEDEDIADYQDRKDEARGLPIPVVCALFVILALSVTGTVLSFRLQSTVTHLREPFEVRRDSYRHVVKIVNVLNAQVHNARAFTQFGDIKYYKLYWHAVDEGEVQDAISDLWQDGITGTELEKLDEALDAYDRIHNYNLISMTLVGDYYDEDNSMHGQMREVFGFVEKGATSLVTESDKYKWSEFNPYTNDNLHRYMSSGIRPPPPQNLNENEPIRNTYHYSDCCDQVGMTVVPDNSLPDMMMATYMKEASKQRVRVHQMFKFGLRAIAHEYKDETVAAEKYRRNMVTAIHNWQHWDQVLYSHYPALRSEEGAANYAQLVNLTQRMQSSDFLVQRNALTDTNSLHIADMYELELNSLVEYLNQRENQAVPRLFENAPDYEAVKHEYEWNDERYQEVLREAAHGEDVLQYIALAYADAIFFAGDVNIMAAAKREVQHALDKWKDLPGKDIHGVPIPGWANEAEQLIRAQTRILLSPDTTSAYQINAIELSIEQVEDQYHADADHNLLIIPGGEQREDIHAFKEHIARSVVFTDYYVTEIAKYRMALAELSEMILERTKEDTEQIPQQAKDFAFQCIIIYTLAAAGLLCVALFYKRYWLCVIVIAVAVAASLAADIEDHSKGIEEAYSQVTRLDSVKNTSVHIIEYGRDTALNYAQFGDALKFEQYWSFYHSAIREDSANELVGVSTFQDSALKDIESDSSNFSAINGNSDRSPVESQVLDYTHWLKEAQEKLEEANVLERSAMAMAVRASHHKQAVFVPRLMQRHGWNVTGEEGFKEDMLRYVGCLDSPNMHASSGGYGEEKDQTDVEDDEDLCMHFLKYTDPGHDLDCEECSAVLVFEKARAIMSSRKYTSLLMEAEEPVIKIATEATKHWEATSDDKQGALSPIVIVIAALGCAAVALEIAFILFTTSRVVHTSSGDPDQQEMMEQMNKHLFARMTRRVRVALAAVVVLLAVLFAVLFSGLESTRRAAKNLNLATSRQWHVARALVVANTVPDNFAVTIRQNQTVLRHIADEMLQVNAELYFGGEAGQYSYVGMSDEQDKLLFGPAQMRSSAEVFDIYKPCSSGQATVGQGTTSYRTNLEPVNTQYLSFVAKLNTVAHASDEVLSDRIVVRSLINELNEVADELLQGLQASSSRARDQVRDHAQQNIMWCAVIIVLTVVMIALEYRFVFLPMISQLVTEEDGTRLMLNMIPFEVRESVPRIAEYFSTGNITEEEKIKKQLQQSEKLLQNILPPAIARRLKSGESLIADDHKSLTVAFCACDGLDVITKGMKARDIVAFLNDLFTRFDELTDRLDLEKIKTIGDVYFMCGGLTEKTANDHAIRVVDTVLKFFEALEQHKVRYNTPTLMMKAGINTGPAVAGVIGSKKVAYDLWGDAVNVSSRLCGTGLSGKIAVNPSTRALVSGYFSFRERKVVAKGKGELTTYVLIERTQPSPFSWVGT